MTLRLRKTDIDLLCLLAERRILTTAQIAHATSGRRRSTQWRMAQLAGEGYLEEVSHRPEGWWGRPERVLSLAEKGFEEIQRRGLLAQGVCLDRVGMEGEHYVDHDLLLNWTRLHLEQIPRACDIMTL